MNIKVLNIKHITIEFAKNKLSEPEKLTKSQINDYLDIISAINNDQYVYNIETNNGEYILYITAKLSNINVFKDKNK